MLYDEKTSLLLDRNELLKRLLKYGLFSERLPNCFSSKKFGKYFYNRIQKGSFQSSEKEGYKHVYFPLTQDNQTRIMAIPNCIGYANLCCVLFENWQHITNYLLKNWEKGNPNFVRMRVGKKRLFVLDDYDGSVEPYFFPIDGRIISLSNNVWNKYSIISNQRIFKKYQLHLDISKFYHTIYAHSLSWALIGKEIEKELYKDRKKREKYIDNNYNYKSIETHVMRMQDGESFGLPIGPDTSFILADILLSRIDAEMQKNFSYYRYIDDFNFYAKTDEDLTGFEAFLRKSLYTYKLQINDTKKEIKNLPNQLESLWVQKLRGYKLPCIENDRFNLNELIYFLDLCVEESKNNGARVIKYGLIKLSEKYKNLSSISSQGRLILCNYLFHNIALYPHLISVFEAFIPLIKEKNRLIEFLNALLSDCMQRSLFDIIVWILYFSIKYNFKLKADAIFKKKQIRCMDCLVITMLYYYLKKIVKKRNVDEIFNNFYETKIKDKFEKEYWLLEYELYLHDVIQIDGRDAYCSEIKVLKSEGISFIEF